MIGFILCRIYIGIYGQFMIYTDDTTFRHSAKVSLDVMFSIKDSSKIENLAI